VQSFARGIRLADPNRSPVLPFDGEREYQGILVLAQVAGLTRELHEHNISHRDIKPDALFWDEQARLVEVIDWNRATSSATDKDKALDFSLGMKRTVCPVLLGKEVERLPKEPGHLLHALFATPEGARLSRGTRLLLARLFDLAIPSAHAVQDVSRLSETLHELATWWLEPMPAIPPGVPEKEQNVEGLSRLLSRADIERCRPDGVAEHLELAARQGWYQRVMEAAQEEVRGALVLWRTYPKHMHQNVSKVEVWWWWLPDVWPLALVMPLARAWLAHTQQHNDALAALVEQVQNRQWTGVQATIQQVTPLLPDPVRPRLKELNKVARDHLEREEIKQLRDEMERLRKGNKSKPTAQGQRRLWEVLEQLKQKGFPDAHHDAQQQVVGRIKMAEQALKTARERAEGQAWKDAKATLEPWHDHQELVHAAPDLAAEIDQTFDMVRANQALATAKEQDGQRAWRDAKATLVPWYDRKELAHAAPDLAAEIDRLFEKAQERFASTHFGEVFDKVEEIKEHLRHLEGMTDMLRHKTDGIEARLEKVEAQQRKGIPTTPLTGSDEGLPAEASDGDKTPPSTDQTLVSPHPTKNWWNTWGKYAAGGVAFVLLFAIIGVAAWLHNDSEGTASTDTPTPSTTLASGTTEGEHTPVPSPEGTGQVGGGTAEVQAPLVPTSTLEPSPLPTSTPQPSPTPTPTPLPLPTAEPSPTPVPEPLPVTLNYPTNKIIHELPMTFVVRAGHLETTSPTLRIEQQTIPLSYNPLLQPGATTAFIDLPVTLLSYLTDPFTLPTEIGMLFGEAHEQIWLTLGNPLEPRGVEVEVRGVYSPGKDAPERKWVIYNYDWELVGANLWKTSDPARRIQATDVVTSELGYILLNNGDRVRILGGTADHYHVAIVTNQADNDVEEVVGKKGWIWRQFVDGNQGGE
jgi:hypothetical protein